MVFFCPTASFHRQYSDRKVHAPEKNEHSRANSWSRRILIIWSDNNLVFMLLAAQRIFEGA